MQPFKVFFDVPEGEVRRFKIEDGTGHMFRVVCQMIEAVVGHENFIVTWKDSDNDSIHVASESEFTECVDHTAWRTRRGDLIKLYVKSASQEEPHGKNKFEGVTCDGCDGPVVGTRYKCLVCKDFDLCVKCETIGKHCQHTMLVIRKQRDLKKTLSKIDPDFKSLIAEKPKTVASVLSGSTENLAATQRDLTALANSIGIKPIKINTAKAATLKPVTKVTATPTTKQGNAIPPVIPVIPVAVDAPLTITSIEPTKAQSVAVSTEDFPPMPPPPFSATTSSTATTKPTPATHIGPSNGSFQYIPYSPFGANQMNGFYLPSGFDESPFSPYNSSDNRFGPFGGHGGQPPIYPVSAGGYPSRQRLDRWRDQATSCYPNGPHGSCGNPWISGPNFPVPGHGHLVTGAEGRPMGMDPAKIKEFNNKLKSKMANVAADRAAKNPLAEARAAMAKAAAEFNEFRKAADKRAGPAKLEEDLAESRRVAHGSFATKFEQEDLFDSDQEDIVPGPLDGGRTRPTILSKEANGTMKDIMELVVEKAVKQGATAAVYPDLSKKVENTPATLKETVETALGRLQKVRGQEPDDRAETAEKSKETDEIYKAGFGPAPGSPQSGWSAGDSFRTLSAESSDGEAGWDVMASTDTIKSEDFFAPAEMTKEFGGSDLRMEEAIEALSAMGFKEEQGILRRLLEDFGGDINMVLDKLNKISK